MYQYNNSNRREFRCEIHGYECKLIVIKKVITNYHTMKVWSDRSVSANSCILRLIISIFFRNCGNFLGKTKFVLIILKF